MKNDGVEAAFDHLGKVDLRLEPLRVVLLPREVLRIDVVVRVERDHAIVNRARPLDERLVCGAGLAKGSDFTRNNQQGDGGGKTHVTVHGRIS